MSEVIIEADSPYWDMEKDWLYESCPDCLGFDVTIQLKHQIHRYGKDELEPYHIKSVWMSLSDGRSIDIRSSLPSAFLREICEKFNDELPEEESEPDWDNLPGGHDYNREKSWV
jgi:hypothetical protein